MALITEFAYRAVDPKSGAMVKGTMESGTEAAVVAKLRAQGMMPLEVAPVSKTGLNQEIKLFGDRKK
ncbi:MAG: hypothetical protein VB093_03410, partial [Propionicimonas sp.]|nr:hypothetical protein [Propionicimonas sp.]